MIFFKFCASSSYTWGCTERLRQILYGLVRSFRFSLIDGLNCLFNLCVVVLVGVLFEPAAKKINTKNTVTKPLVFVLKVGARHIINRPTGHKITKNRIITHFLSYQGIMHSPPQNVLHDKIADLIEQDNGNSHGDLSYHVGRSD